MNLTKSFIFVAAIAAILFTSGRTDRNDPDRAGKTTQTQTTTFIPEGN